MNVTSVEISKELYQLSNGSWDDTYHVWQNRSDDGGETVHYALITHGDHEPYDYPAYDLGYLLRKLPNVTLWHDSDNSADGQWVAKSPHGGKIGNIEFADTPEDATA